MSFPLHGVRLTAGIRCWDRLVIKIGLEEQDLDEQSSRSCFLSIKEKMINTLIYKELPICFKVDESNDICSVLKQHIT